MPELLLSADPVVSDHELPPWSMLVVDDDQATHTMTQLVLKNLRFDNRPLQLTSAYSKAEAQSLLTPDHSFDVLIVDVVMESHTAGLELVRWIREQLGDKKVRLLLRTGQPGDMPELTVMHQFEINDYISKTECTTVRLSCAVIAALRARREIAALAYEQQLHAVRDLMLSHLGHQVRTPLHAIQGNAELGLAQAPDLQLTGYFRHIQQAARQLQGVFADLLDFACLRHGELPLAPCGCRPQELVELLQSQFRHSPQHRQCTLLTEISSEVPAGIWIDQARLQQILSNLISNALQAAPKGQIRLSVRMQPSASQQPGIRFEVKDDGCGISSALAAQIRQQWQHGWQGVEMRGIGLYISYHLALLMGGTLDFVSNGSGSEFWLELPCLRWDGSPSAPVAPVQQQTGGAGARVLVVDDSAVNLEIACAVLQNAGFTADGASDGLTAIAMLRQSDYAAILMDVQMPELDGFATTARIRQLPAGHGIPIIAITAHAMAGYREQCLACGMNDYLTKPVDADTLVATVQRWLPAIPAIESPQPAAVTSASQAAPEVLREDSALRRLGGNRSLLDKLLAEFVSTANPNRPELLLATLQAGDLPLALRMVHTLKGESGTLAAEALQQRALQLEQRLQQGEPWHEVLQQLQHEFTRLDAVVRQRMAPPARLPDDVPAVKSPAAPAITDSVNSMAEATQWQQVAADLQFNIAEALLWRQLDYLLQIQSLDAELVLQQLQKTSPAVLQPALRQMAQALQSFDFQQARQLCQHIAGSLL